MKKKQSLSMLMILTLVLSIVIPVGMPIHIYAESVPTFNVNEGSITIGAGTGENTIKVTHGGDVTDNINSSDTILITGTADTPTTNTIVVDGVTANITLSGVKISSSVCAFELRNVANVTLTLDGTNTLVSGSYRAGLQVPAENMITINGSGSLDAKGGIAGTGIGGGDGAEGGNITIKGGIVKAIGGNYGAGIGGGNGGAGGIIRITGGTVTATGGAEWGAGIGGGKNGAGGTITIEGGEVTATGGERGAGIGGGDDGAGGTIIIEDGTVTATGGSGGAGIGGGRAGAVGTITIKDGMVKATGGPQGAGIGGGQYGTVGTINITGGIVTATGGEWGAGIGGGDDGAGGTIIIEDGTVEATSGSNSAGIGGGRGGAVGTITIKDGMVKATGGSGGAGIGSGIYGAGGNITIKNGKVEATSGSNSAGIGAGAYGAGGNITIEGGTVTATSTGGGAGIGGCWEGSGDTITIEGGTVTATSMSGGAGIGGGYKGAGGNIIIKNHPTVIATKGNDATDIGNGASSIGETTIKYENNNDLTYVRLEVKNGTDSLNDKNTVVNGNTHKTDKAGITGFFVNKSTDIEHAIRVEDTQEDIGLVPGDHQNTRMVIDIANLATVKLTGLSVSSPTAITPAFSSDHYQYTAENVGYPVTAIEIAPEGPVGGTITINGESGPFQAMSLAVGNNVFDIKVAVAVDVANPGVKYQKTYTVTVTRAAASSNSNLSALSISEGTLTPAFASGTTTYTANVGNEVNSITVTPTVADSNATVTVNSTAVTSGSASAAITLNVGNNTIPVIVTAQDGTTTKTYTVTVTRAAASSGSDDSYWSPPTPAAPVPPTDNSEGTQQSGIETIEEINGRTEVKLEVDAQKMTDHIAEIIKDPTNNKEITLAVINTGDITKVSISGDILKNLKDNEFKISIKEEKIEYRIDATNFAIENIAQTMNIPVDSLQNIEIEISINKLPSDQAQAFTQQAQANGHVLLFMPVQFEITARTTLADGSTQEIKITKFTSFAERVLEMPGETDPDDIGTAVVFNPNGTYSHVPTVVFQKEGKTHVGIKSLTNSIYTVIANQLTLDTVKGHWSETQVNDMAIRLILVDYENFQADQTITRAEFADYIVRAFGLHREGLTITNKFTDISTNKQRTSILIANDWGIIQGYPDHTFKPDATITRQEAMTMYARAMDLANIVENKADQLTSFHDNEEVSAWATAHVRRVVNAEIFTGKGNGILDPKGTLTHAESLTAIRNLLLKAELINE